MSLKNNFPCCLYYTSASLARVVNELAEKEFMSCGLSPSYAFLVMLVIESPGISPNELCSQLNLKPSTITRFTFVY